MYDTSFYSSSQKRSHRRNMQNEMEEQIACATALAQGSESFLKGVVSKLDVSTRERLQESLLSTSGSPSMIISMSPSRWDCPIQQTAIFKKQLSRPRFTSKYHESQEKQIVNIIIPSLSVDVEELKKLAGPIHYEERQLYTLLALKDPNVHIIYLTALPLHPSIVNYYLSFVKDNPEERLTLFSTFDTSNKSLTEKIMERPRLIAKIKRTVEKLGSNVSPNMLCFIPTKHEHKLSKLLDAKLEASPDEIQFWGSKCGSRQIFKECDVPLPRGIFESIFNEEELVKQIGLLWDQIPDIKRIIVKLNEGFSGEGNAMLLMDPISSRLMNENSSRENEIKAELKNLRFQASSETWERFSKKIGVLGVCLFLH